VAASSVRAEAQDQAGSAGAVNSRASPLSATASAPAQPGVPARLRDGLVTAHQADRTMARHAAPASEAVVPSAKVPWLARIRPAGLIVAMVVVMFATSWGTYRSVPGELLYPLKRASESALLGLSVDDSARAKRELVTARTRASEAATLARVAGPKRDELLRETIDDMDSTTRFRDQDVDPGQAPRPHALRRRAQALRQGAAQHGRAPAPRPRQRQPAEGGRLPHPHQGVRSP